MVRKALGVAHSKRKPAPLGAGLMMGRWIVDYLPDGRLDGCRTWRHSFSSRARTSAGIVCGAAVLGVMEVLVCMSSLLMLEVLAPKRVCEAKVPQC